jgi:hypothetical protein
LQNVPSPGRGPGAGDHPAVSYRKRACRHAACETQAVPDQMTHKSTLPEGPPAQPGFLPDHFCLTEAPPAQPVPSGPLLSTRRTPGPASSFRTALSNHRGRETLWQCGGAEEARYRCTWYTVARSRSPVPLALAPDDVGLLTVSGPNDLLSNVDKLWRWCFVLSANCPML